MGAFGAWSLAVSQPKMFAAIVPICGGFIGHGMPMETSLAQMLSWAPQEDPQDSCYIHKLKQALQKCKKMPVWLFHGLKDKRVHPKCSQFVFEAMGGTSNEHLHMTTFPRAHHSCWGRVYNNVAVYTWLLQNE